MSVDDNFPKQGLDICFSSKVIDENLFSSHIVGNLKLTLQLAMLSFCASDHHHLEQICCPGKTW